MKSLKGSVIAVGFAGLGLVAVGARADDAPAAGEKITYNKQVSRIFQSKCQDCHRPGELAPMSLIDYKDVRPWAKAIKKSVANRDMPPWKADPHFGKFRNDISLNEADLETIVKWVDQGAPEGDAADAPEPKKWSDSPWSAGEPDLVLLPKKPFHVPLIKKNEDIYQCIVLPTGIKEDTWVTGFEWKIDNRKVVHHVIGFVADAAEAMALDAQTPDVSGFPCGMGGGGGLRRQGIDAMIGGWAPGTPPNVYSNGVGKILKGGSAIIMQMHYNNPTELEHDDLSGVGIHFAKETIHKQGRIMPVSAWNLSIKAGDPEAKHTATWKAPRDIDIVSIMPHMHYIGKAMTVTAIYQDGKEETLIKVPKFDFNWQTVFAMAEPKRIPQGTTIRMDSVHDNSASNPANPSNPPVDVKWGESTTEEMAIGWLGYVNSDEDLNVTPKPPVFQIGEAAGETKQVSAK